MRHLPGYYKKSGVVISITDAAESEIDAAADGITGTGNQFFVETADASLGRWEADLGLRVSPSRPDSFRRSNILSRLRGHGTITAAFVKNIAESYSYGEVEVIEDYANYSITVAFVGTVGLPPNLEDLLARLTELRPAHLELIFEFTYVQHIMLEQFTHAQLAAFTHEGIRTMNVRSDGNG